MKLVTTKFKSGGLHEKHVVATWNHENHLSICFQAQGNQGKPVSRWPVAGLSEYSLLASSPASKVKKQCQHSTTNTHKITTHTRQLQQYARSTNNNYTKDNLKLATKHTRQMVIIYTMFCATKRRLFLRYQNYSKKQRKISWRNVGGDLVQGKEGVIRIITKIPGDTKGRWWREWSEGQVRSVNSIDTFWI